MLLRPCSLQYIMNSSQTAGPPPPATLGRVSVSLARLSQGLFGAASLVCVCVCVRVRCRVISALVGSSSIIYCVVYIIY